MVLLTTCATPIRGKGDTGEVGVYCGARVLSSEVLGVLDTGTGNPEFWITGAGEIHTGLLTRLGHYR